MKKIFSFIFIFFSLVLLIGCGNKKIHIENNTEQQNDGFEESIKIDYFDDEENTKQQDVDLNQDILDENETEYKLLDRYCYPDYSELEELEDIEYNLVYRRDILVDEYSFISDSANIIVKLSKLEAYYTDYDNYELVLNINGINYIYNLERREWGWSYWNI